jgi:D-alanyl-D-alanine dipeptidase
MFFRALFATAAVLIMAAFSFSQVKRPEPVAVQIPFDKSLQAIIVTTDDWNSIHGTARLVERKTTHSKWKEIGDEFPVVVGRSGIGRDPLFNSASTNAPTKHEGDGKAPAGLFPLTFAFGNIDVGSRLPFTKLDEFTECVDDTRSAFYNKIVNRMQVGNFDWNSSEKMLAVGSQYDLGVFVAYNFYPAVRGNGSCIFLHIWKDANTGTSGCTAMTRENLQKVVRFLDPSKNPYLVQLTKDDYSKAAKSYHLPLLDQQ